MTSSTYGDTIMILKSNQIEAARLFTNKKETRLLCSHSFIINGKLVSTDGHGMLVQQLTNCPVNFKKIDINSIVKGQGIDLSVHDPRVSEIEELDKIWNSLNRVIPQETSGVTSTFDADLLVKVKKASRFLGVKEEPIQYNGNDASLIQWDDGSFAVIMPMRFKPQEKLPVPSI